MLTEKTGTDTPKDDLEVVIEATKGIKMETFTGKAQAVLGDSTLKKRRRKKSYSNYVKKQGCHFTEAEDVQLLECVKLYGEQWSRISKLLFKSMVKCHKRYKQLTGAKDEHA